MSCVPDVLTTQSMYSQYIGGATCSRVAAQFGVTRQTVWDRFRRAGLLMRPSSRSLALPYIDYNGARYAPDKDGYFRKTTDDRNPLHHDKWIGQHGNIKRGWVVRFVDGDRMNLDQDNLESVPRAEMARAAAIIMKPCLACDRLMGRRATGNHPEGPSAYAKRKTCNAQCSAHWKRGKPRGARMGAA